MEKEEDKYKVEELIKRYNIDIKKLEQEQIKLAKNLEIEDTQDFENINRIAGIENIFVKNNIISAIVIIEDGEMTEQEYFSDRIKFPYISGFRAYRELPAMLGALDKIDIKPDLILIRGNGIMHQRMFGIASHFSIATGIPTIGVSDTLDEENFIIKAEEIYLKDKLVGKIIKTKEGANPLYVSVGNKISLNTAVEIVKKLTKEPHKIPEPLRLAKKYAKEIGKEIFNS